MSPAWTRSLDPHARGRRVVAQYVLAMREISQRVQDSPATRHAATAGVPERDNHVGLHKGRALGLGSRVRANDGGQTVEFVSTRAATAIPASKALLEWGSRHGLPEWIISDGGTHFANHALKLVSQRMGVRHHITLAHCPWSNGSVEIVGFDLIYTLRCVLSELEMLMTQWPEVIPLVQYAINHRPRESLGGRTPIEVMTGRAPDSALDLVLWTGVTLKDAEVIEAGIEQVDRYCDRLQASLDAIHTEVKDRELQRQRAKAAKETNDRLTYRFEVGDLVMVTVADTSLNPVCVDKPRMRWQGPCMIVDIPEGEPSNLYVRLLGDPDTVTPKPVHWTRARRFAGKEFTTSPRLIRSAQHDLGKFRLRDFLAWRVGEGGKV